MIFNVIGNQAKKSKSDQLNLVALLNSLFEIDEGKEIMPILYVQYSFNGKSFEVYAWDNEALILPSRKAVEIKIR